MLLIGRLVYDVWKPVIFKYEPPGKIPWLTWPLVPDPVLAAFLRFSLLAGYEGASRCTGPMGLRIRPHALLQEKKAGPMSVTANFLWFLKPVDELPAYGEAVTPVQLHTLAVEMYQRLSAIASATHALSQDGWHLSLQGSEMCASHPEVRTRDRFN
jgi:hypothetical protein